MSLMSCSTWEEFKRKESLHMTCKSVHTESEKWNRNTAFNFSVWFSVSFWVWWYGLISVPLKWLTLPWLDVSCALPCRKIICGGRFLIGHIKFDTLVHFSSEGSDLNSIHISYVQIKHTHCHWPSVTLAQGCLDKNVTSMNDCSKLRAVLPSFAQPWIPS